MIFQIIMPSESSFGLEDQVAWQVSNVKIIKKSLG
jgi:hypothetical protein